MRLPLLLLLTALPAAQAHSSLTELESVKLDNIRLQVQLADALKVGAACQAELGPVRARVHQTVIDEQVAALKKLIEANHPGFVFDPQTGALSKK